MWQLKWFNIIIVVLGILPIYSYLLLVHLGNKTVFRDEDYHNDKGSDISCIAPNGCRGKCVDVYDCPVLLSLMSNLKQHEFLKQSQCGWNQTVPKVCCPYWTCTDSYKELRFNKKRNMAAALAVPPDPSLHSCGRGVTSNISGEGIRLIAQSPWTAAIEYTRNYVIMVKCGGTLISTTFVLTAAHCLLVKAWKPVNIRLGDYDIDHPGKDCVSVTGGFEDCTDEPVIIPIERTIMHPDFGIGSRLQANDIALIRLMYVARYTEDFIRPICLPTADLEDTGATSSTKLTAVGWGAIDEIRSYSSTKHHVELPFIRRMDCLNVYRRYNITLGKGQICAGGETGKDSCKGDSGGALMLVKEKFTEIVGITSFGYMPCGTKNMPAVYTNVYQYLPWIKSIIH